GSGGEADPRSFCLTRRRRSREDRTRRVAMFSRGVLVAVVVLLASSAARAATPADVCEGGKLRGAAHGAYKALKCHAKAARTGVTTDGTCLAQADGVIARDIAAAEG